MTGFRSLWVFKDNQKIETRVTEMVKYLHGIIAVFLLGSQSTVYGVVADSGV